MIRFRSVTALCAAAALGFAGCGEDEATESAESPEQRAAAEPNVSQFPEVGGRTLEQVASSGKPGPRLGAATSRYVVGENRIAFGLLDEAGSFLYAPTAVYVADSPKSVARGPFLAPADSLITEPAFRSKQAALEGDIIASIYSTSVSFPRPGKQSLLFLSAIEDGYVGVPAELEVERGDPIPAIGDPAPVVPTETVNDTPDSSLLETRDPADQMHETSFDQVVGERPALLLFSTPALCESRVCGPVTDIAAQVQRDYGDEIEFIHQEPYVKNDPTKGLRPPLQAFSLQTEPWLFAVDAEGNVVDRLEGSFGLDAVELAAKRALGEA